MSLSNILSKKNRALLRELIITDFKLRYQGSALGYLWSLLKPLFLFAILYTVFGHFLKIGANIEHYPIYLLLGIVLWNFFLEATTQGMQAIVARGDLIRKINFPKYVIVMSATVSALINLILNLLVVGVFLLVGGVDFTQYALLFPVAVLELYVFALALSFLLAAAYVRFRDLSHIWEIMLQAAFYATPVLYPIDMVLQSNETVGKLLLLNPVAQILQDARAFLVTPQTITLYEISHTWYIIAIPFVIIGAIAVVASVYFKKSSRNFAENI